MLLKRRNKKDHQAANSSFGIILIAFVKDEEPRVCLVQRKNSFGYISCIMHSESITSETLSTITREEKDKLLSYSWDDLWKDCCGSGGDTTKLYHKCKAKFEWLSIRDTIKMLDDKCNWQHDQMWSLPKGRTCDANELPLRCAMREMYEETGINCAGQTKIKFISTPTLKDEYEGTNGKKYASTYYLFVTTDIVPPSVASTNKEVKQAEWKTLAEAQKILQKSTFDVIQQAFFQTSQTCTCFE